MLKRVQVAVVLYYHQLLTINLRIRLTVIKQNSLVYLNSERLVSVLILRTSLNVSFNTPIKNRVEFFSYGKNCSNHNYPKCG